MTEALSQATGVLFETLGRSHSDMELWIDNLEVYDGASYPIS